MFFRDVLRADAVKALQAAITGRERVGADGKQAYIVYPDGIGRSRVTNAFIEKMLGSRGTGPELEHRAQAWCPGRGMSDG